MTYIKNYLAWGLALLSIAFIFFVTVSSPVKGEELTGKPLVNMTVKVTMVKYGCGIPVGGEIIDPLIEKVAKEKGRDPFDMAKQLAVAARIVWDELGLKGQRDFCTMSQLAYEDAQRIRAKRVNQ